MDQLQTRLDALEQRTHTVERRLRWWRGLACGLVGLAVLAWMLPAVIAQEDAANNGQQGLAQRVAALESLLKHVSRKGNDITIKGANLHLVNGLGSTGCGIDETIPDRPNPNGLGNLIVGYNEPRGFEPDIRTGSHNVVVGQGHNFSRWGGLVVGVFNTINGDFAAVSGGFFNTASGRFASVSGGGQNTASGERAAVSGGSGNTASGSSTSVSGGQNNTASGSTSSVSGGLGNTASGYAASVSGGGFNALTGEPGAGNTASGDLSSVSGGSGNTASGSTSSVSGGQNITQETENGWAAGSEAEADEVVVGNFRSP